MRSNQSVLDLQRRPWQCARRDAHLQLPTVWKHGCENGRDRLRHDDLDRLWPRCRRPDWSAALRADGDAVAPPRLLVESYPLSLEVDGEVGEGLPHRLRWLAAVRLLVGVVTAGLSKEVHGAEALPPLATSATVGRSQPYDLLKLLLCADRRLPRRAV
eukprot:CAMPEP_0178450538 /NCGR_PEP_ID=MMETSP0689_2-20121128/43178_1 /TAXON_ID=160604 /ORGANISM="Amphidinium massartii, Strain CS-259" /LENGTH=157 /DNA_ID=CAMNT_0020076011 /DNA_START=16 /DNA_END=489 /DNA_ORIENTATION=-